MANLLYRISSTPTVPSATSVKNAPLTNLEIDANFKSVDNDLSSIKTTITNANLSIFNTSTTNPTGTARVNMEGYFYATRFYGDGSNLTSLNATNISSGTVSTARLGSGTASSSTYLRGDGTWASLPGATLATSLVIGGVKLISDTVQSVTANNVSTVPSRTYGVQVNSDGQAVVNVPWTDTLYSLTTGSETAIGGIKLFSDAIQTVTANAVSTAASRTYGVQVNASGQAVVNVPWTDTNTTYAAATSTTLGLIQLFSNTVQSVAANAVSATADRTYGIQVNAAGQAVVNVPWVNQVSIADDTSTNATRYITFTQSTSGTINSANVSSSKLTFNPSTGDLSAVGFNSTSDIRLKEDITDIDNALDTINQLNGVEFTFTESKLKSAGVIAQDIQNVLPHAVSDRGDGYLAVNYNTIIAYLIEANKELLKRVQVLENQLN